MRNRRTTAVAAVVGVLAVAGIATAVVVNQNPTDDTASSPIVAEFEGRDAREVIDELEATPAAERRTDIFASVRADELLITDLATGVETSLPKPAGLFYYSFAPYVDQTHPCTFHSLTTCLGEMGNTDVHVLVVTDDGDTLVDETRTTSDAGWVGLWLPAEITGTITVTYGDLSVTSPIATGDDDKTCDSTLQLT